MPFTIETELGHQISLGDWCSFHRDRILRVLYEMWLRQGTSDDQWITRDQVRYVTGLDEVLVDRLLASMSEGEGPRLGKFAGFEQPQTLILRTLQRSELSATRLRGSFVSGTPVRLDCNDGYLVCLQRRPLRARSSRPA